MLPRPLIEPQALLRIADAVGTPTYVYAEARVRQQIDQLRTAFDGLPVRLLYAMKANASPAVLRVIQAEGLGLDTVSPGELELALRLGFDPAQILFSANNMTDAEMHEAHAAGAFFNIGERSRLEAFGCAYPGAEVCLRLNPQIGGGHHDHVVTAGERSKFGIPVAELGEAKVLAAHHGLRIVGLHQHIGSGLLDPALYARAMRVLLTAARGLDDLRFLNFGGGFGVAYAPDQEPFDFARLRALVKEELHVFLSERPRDFTFWFEPGRFLVAEAGALLVRANTLKEANGRTFAGTDSGMGHLIRPAVYGAYHRVVNLTNPEGPLRTYDVTGNICEAGDLFARDRAVAEIREGDVLAVLQAGAYGMAMASEYNLRPLPAEVLLRSDGTHAVARRRQTYYELVDRWLADEIEAQEPIEVPGARPA